MHIQAMDTMGGKAEEKGPRFVQELEGEVRMERMERNAALWLAISEPKNRTTPLNKSRLTKVFGVRGDRIRFFTTS